jgi:glycosyltransferase involved in cell wall biosynthesis
MIILVSSKISQADIHASLGKPEYSYFFLMKDFLPALEQLGTVIQVQSRDQIESLYASYSAQGEAVIFISVSPPHQTPLDLKCPTVTLFAWEFDSLPSVAWDDNPQNDWRYVFAHTSGAIATSREVAGLVAQSMGEYFPVIALPAPVWARFADVCPQSGWEVDLRPRSFEFAGQVIDSRNLKLDPESVAHRPVSEAKRISQALLRGWWHEVRLPKKESVSPQTAEKAETLSSIKLEGIVYVSVLNPEDGRKNWADLISAFCLTFRDEEDATLLLKMTHYDIDYYRTSLLTLLARLPRFRCRVLVLHGFLDDAQYLQLIQASTYYVNASSGEGLCLPLMEFLCCGKPAIAPSHTAMADYIDENFAFIVNTCLEPSCWSHDPAGMARTHSHRLNWESLAQAYRASYAVTRSELDYMRLSRCARQQLESFCSLARVSNELGGFLQGVIEFAQANATHEELSE